MKKKKILLSAYACEPNKGSESAVGWDWALNLTRNNCEVYVVTRLNNKRNIENYLKKKPNKNLKFIYFDFSKFILKYIKGQKNSYSYLYFFLWQIGIFFKTYSYIKKINFDYIHHVTFVSIRIPSFLCFYKIPFIFGPVSGGDVSPIRLRKSFSTKYKIKEYLRDLSNFYIKFSPLMNLVFLNSKHIFVNSNETKNLLPKIYHKKVSQLIAIGIDDKKINYYKKKSSIFTITFAANLYDIKGSNIIVRVYDKLLKNNYNLKLYLIGNGYLKKSLINYLIQNNIFSKIIFKNKISQKKFFEVLKKSNIFVAPYLRDSGGMTLLESLSMSTPVITFDIGGPNILINKKCGIKITTKKKNEMQIVNDLYDSITKLINNKKTYLNIQKNTFKRCRKFTWQNKIKEVYKNV